MVEKILLSQKFGTNIFTRNTISAFFDELRNSKETEIILDFKDVEFISRSCADEYLKQKQKTKNKIIEANVSNEVCEMFNVVKNQYEREGFTISFNLCQTGNLISA